MKYIRYRELSTGKYFDYLAQAFTWKDGIPYTVCCPADDEHSILLVPVEAWNKKFVIDCPKKTT